MSIVRSLRATLASATLKVTKVKINIGLDLMFKTETLIKNTFNIKSSKIIIKIIR